MGVFYYTIMLLIADSGSTKTHWALICPDTQQVLRQTTTVGLNPVLVDVEYVLTVLAGASALRISSAFTLYFYGAGCGSQQANSLLDRAFRSFFSTVSDVYIANDVQGASLALYRGEPVIACILGTGSNACYYDGEVNYGIVDSLGYLLGDEGSGNFFGKQLLHAYYYGYMPEELRMVWEQEYDVDLSSVISSLYDKPRPNAYLASFMPFVVRYRSHGFVHELLVDGFERFLRLCVLPHPRSRECRVSFVGSVAYYCQQELRQGADRLGLLLGDVVQSPIDGLVRYHMAR